jgi:1D-myo-inositol-tetrakisphosphate 5-kinase/inositol-polyphosphate multikinase
MGAEFPHQVAGHAGQLFCHSEPGKVVKFCERKEREFYEALFETEAEIPWKTALRPWLPAYYGTSDGGRAVILENLVHSFTNPSIVDIKLGAVLHDVEASEDKKQRLAKVSAETTSGSMGLRICGMKVGVQMILFETLS